MPKYVCKRCNFRFDSNNPRECGYCGRSDSLEVEKSAVDLLDEVDKLLEG